MFCVKGFRFSKTLNANYKLQPAIVGGIFIIIIIIISKKPKLHRVSFAKAS